MKPSHIYQPVLIRALVEAGGKATLRQLAQVFVSQDESQLQFYERRIKGMPVKVLGKHGVVERDGELISLTVPRLTFQQKAEVMLLCETRLQAYVKQRGLAIWDYRLLEVDPVSDNLRFQALTAAGGRCALCGATKKERPLDIAHIVPRSRGGKNQLENLQVLCSKCNRTKGNKDTTGFRAPSSPDSDPACPFCAADRQNKAVALNGSVFALLEGHPVAPGHHLVIPKRHTADYLRRDATNLLRVLRKKILDDDTSVVGFNVGMNCSEAARQTVMHAHVHLIPRRKGDTPQPRGVCAE